MMRSMYYLKVSQGKEAFPPMPVTGTRPSRQRKEAMPVTMSPVEGREMIP